MTDRHAAQTLPMPEPMRWWDIPFVTALESALFEGDGPWSAAMFWAELAARHRYRVVRAPAGQVLGYAGLATGPEMAEVHTIAVAPQSRRRGIGHRLLSDMLGAAQGLPVVLEVRSDNAPAIALYRAHGFEQVGVRRGYYQPSGADAYTMIRPTPSAFSGGDRHSGRS